jgi:hypothetical protein
MTTAGANNSHICQYFMQRVTTVGKENETPVPEEIKRKGRKVFAKERKGNSGLHRPGANVRKEIHCVLFAFLSGLCV